MKLVGVTSLFKEISDSILKLHEERKYTFCIIEHDIDFITKLCDPVIVLAEGKVHGELLKQ